jgi:hypothetical protein
MGGLERVLENNFFDELGFVRPENKHLGFVDMLKRVMFVAPIPVVHVFFGCVREGVDRLFDEKPGVSC